MKNLRRSVAWSNSQCAFANAISGKYLEGVIEKWLKACNEFDKDPKKKNPYEEPKIC